MRLLVFTGIFFLALVYAVYITFVLRQLQKDLAKAQRRTRQESVLKEILAGLASELDAQRVVNVILEGVKTLARAEASAFAAVRDREVAGFYSSSGGDRIKDFLIGILKEAVDKGIPLRGKAWVKGLRGFLAVPVFLNRDVSGVLLATNPIGRDGFSAEDEDYLMILGFQAGLSIERAGAYSETVGLAQRDALTGLYNRRVFHERVKSEAERAGRLKREFSVLMLDIDFFKQFNDKHGHPTGDEALKAVARILSSKTRSIDCVSRWGGEEFTVMLVETRLQDAVRVAERIRTAIEKEPLSTDHGEAHLTVSIGAASYPEDAETPEALIDKADKALYRAKETGRNRVCLFMETVYYP